MSCRSPLTWKLFASRRYVPTVQARHPLRFAQPLALNGPICSTPHIPDYSKRYPRPRCDRSGATPGSDRFAWYGKNSTIAARCRRSGPAFQVRHYAQRRQRSQYNRFKGGSGPRIYQYWQSQNFRYGIGLAVGGSGVFWLANREEVPISGRKRFTVVSPELEKKLAEGTYQETLQQYGRQILPPEHPYSRMTQRVMRRLVSVSGLEDEKWEVRVIDDPDVQNAFVIPGGKVFVFTGILPICRDDEGLAAVLAHEISHSVAHHMGEKISKSFIIGLLGVGITLLFDWTFQSTNVILQLILALPNSREQESEADHIGLLMMAQACYNPEAARELWERMERAERNEGGAVPQFMSTHPSPRNRIGKVTEWLPQALEKRAASNCEYTGPYAAAFDSAVRQQRQQRPKQNVQGGPQETKDDDDWFW